jgi:hypothetical protein
MQKTVTKLRKKYFSYFNIDKPAFAKKLIHQFNQLIEVAKAVKITLTKP